jgi:hypothetical protein
VTNRHVDLVSAAAVALNKSDADDDDDAAVVADFPGCGYVVFDPVPISLVMADRNDDGVGGDDDPTMSLPCDLSVRFAPITRLPTRRRIHFVHAERAGSCILWAKPRSFNARCLKL